MILNKISNVNKILNWKQWNFNILSHYIFRTN